MQKIHFKNEKSPMNILAKSERFLVCSRKLNRRQDADLLKFEVTRENYMTFSEAYNSLKDSPVYTVVDLQENIKGGINLIFDPYDYFDKESCEKLIEDLEKGITEISHRTRIAINVEDLIIK